MAQARVPAAEELIRWLYDLQHLGIKLGLDNIRALLGELGHPERRLRAVIVGGTNGKGSVAAMLQALLGGHGVRSGLFTSPHLVRPNERIRVGDADISDADLAAALHATRARIDAALAAGRLTVHPSFFEVMTATALEAFRARELRAAVLEVGLGGRLDATNAVEAELAVVVSVDLDHTKTLGDTLEKIAGEKAAIAKPGRPLVHGVVRQRALGVLQQACEARGAELVDARLAVRFVGEDGAGLVLQGRERYDGLRLSLPGRHQIDNARVALAAFERFAPALGVEPDPAIVRRALGRVRWPGRLQWTRDGARPGVEILLDGAHNPSGMRTLAGYLRGLGRPAPLAVVGAMRGKLLAEMLAALAPHVRGVVVARPDVSRAADPREVAAVARDAGIREVEIVAAPAGALERVLGRTADGDYALVTGSLYLVGEVLAALGGRVEPGPVAL